MMNQSLLHHRNPMFRAAVILGCVLAATAADETGKVTKSDLPRIPPTEVKAALGTFELGRGFRLEIVAAEPMVSDPVDACFDEFGRMYVAEMHGYPFSQEPTKLNPKGGGKKNAGVIRLLEDSNGDGRMDKSTVFAKGISWPVSVCCYKGGLFVLAPQHLFYFKDTTGDGKADRKETILSGFGRGNVQSMANNLKWGIDNRIWFAAGRNGGTITHRGKRLFSPRGSDIRFDPGTETFELITGGSQNGLCFDDWGVRFVCSNSNHIQQVVFPRRYLSRNPYLSASGAVRGIAADGAASRVFRISPPEPWRIIRQKWRAAAKGYKLVFGKDGYWWFEPLDPTKKKGGVPTEYPVGFFTSATGVSIYRGNAYPPEYRGNAFIGDVGGNLVHRKKLMPHGVSFIAKRADAKTEIIRSRDNWFRPVNFVNAPDGSLYVLDMYRETIEHPHSIPIEIKRFLHLESGDDRGRIYRLVSPKMKRVRPKNLGDMSAAELAFELESLNVWNRQTAQRLLVERQAKTVVPRLEKLVQTSNQPLARLHALWTLRGLDSLTGEVIRAGLRDRHPRVREHAVRLAEAVLKTEPAVLTDLLKLADDADQRVRFQLAFTLGETRDSRAVDAVAKMLADANNNRDLRTALFSSAFAIADQLALELLAKKTVSSTVLAEVCRYVGLHRQTKPALKLLAAVADAKLTASRRQVVLQALGQGLSRRGSSLRKLLADAATSGETRAVVRKMFADAITTAKNAKASVADRAAAIRLLAFADAKQTLPVLRKFLSPTQPSVLQLAAVAAIADSETKQAAQTLLAGWKTHSPKVRAAVLDVLLSDVTGVLALLDAVREKRVGGYEIAREKKQVLLSFPNAAIRARSRKLFAADVTTDRAKVVTQFRDVLNLEGDAARGLLVFRKRCAQCHRAGKEGHLVGPDVKSFQNKSTSDLLIAILDPNRELQSAFQQYNVLTSRAKSYSGIIAAETAASITLKKAEAKQDLILREQIERMQSTGKSLMPEGLEKDINRKQLADVLAYVKSIGK